MAQQDYYADPLGVSYGTPIQSEWEAAIDQARSEDPDGTLAQWRYRARDIINARDKTARSSETGSRLLGLTEQQFDRLWRLSRAQLALSEAAEARTKEWWQRYKTLYWPKEQRFVREAFRPGQPELAAQRAAADVQAMASQGVGEAERRAQAMGIDPSSPAYARLLYQGFGPALGAAKAGAMTRARERQRAQDWSRQSYALGLAKGTPSETAQLGGLGTAYSEQAQKSLTSAGQVGVSGLTNVANLWGAQGENEAQRAADFLINEARIAGGIEAAEAGKTSSFGINIGGYGFEVEI